MKKLIRILKWYWEGFTYLFKRSDVFGIPIVRRENLTHLGSIYGFERADRWETDHEFRKRIHVKRHSYACKSGQYDVVMAAVRDRPNQVIELGCTCDDQ